MRICIDSSAFIVGLEGSDSDAAQILDWVGHEFSLVIPRLIAQEVTRNLRKPGQIRQFYRLFQNYSFAQIIDEPIPADLVNRYITLGLPAKADAFIGAFAE
ncbi:MAG: PIN domain-containing protein [Leptolyngbyaceae cyanobacterium SM2_5_2]|nr:PIN domain-containing protein [Leptolyngbyaceae cyanobacterium SM2_5_2]